ncbi:MAG TPA: hypothetical protein VM537_15890 [Anaerolineae bacterium]|nr:hypothetical protein [Anaerolineae bacterium]
MSLEPNGWIVSTIHPDYQGGIERISYEWEGGDVTTVDPYIVGEYRGFEQIDDNRFRIGPYRLRKVEDEYSWISWTYLRERGLLTDFRVQWHKVGWRLELFYRRCILTLAVWRLAEYRANAYPYWRDVHALRWVAEKARHLFGRTR